MIYSSLNRLRLIVRRLSVVGLYRNLEEFQGLPCRWHQLRAAAIEGRYGSRAVKLLMRICSPDYPRQQTLGWRCRQEIPLAAPVEPPSNFQESVQAWTLRSDPPHQSLGSAPSGATQ